jgi:hypothetical protein
MNYANMFLLSDATSGYLFASDFLLKLGKFSLIYPKTSPEGSAVRSLLINQCDVPEDNVENVIEALKSSAKNIMDIHDTIISTKTKDNPSRLNEQVVSTNIGIQLASFLRDFTPDTEEPQAKSGTETKSEQHIISGGKRRYPRKLSPITRYLESRLDHIEEFLKKMG